MEGPTRHDQQKVEFVNEAEMIMIHARHLARRMQERLWRVMSGHEIYGPNQPTGHEEGREAEDEQKREDEDKENPWAS